MLKEAQIKRRQLEIENEKQRKIHEYEKRLKEKEKRQRNLRINKLYERRVSQTSSPGIRHVQSQENFENFDLLDKIEEK